VSGEGSRRIQRILARRWLPPEVGTARKLGFSVPLDQWLRRASPRWHEGWLERLPRVVNRQAALRLLEGLRAGRANGSRIFALIMLGHAARNLGFE
jgi:asparagine synthase (glutamine-hydrolysing)